MKINALPFGLAAFLASAHASGVRPEKVPTDIVRVEVFGPHRLVVFQVCSPEHCWHQFFVQDLSNSFPPKVTCSKPVLELNETSDMLARSATWLEKPAYSLELSLGSSHGAFDKFTSTISLASGCKYKLRPTMPPAANNSFKPTPLRGAA